MPTLALDHTEVKKKKNYVNSKDKLRKNQQGNLLHITKRSLCRPQAK